MSELEDLCHSLEESVRPLPALAGTLQQRAARLRSVAAQVEQAARQVRNGPNVQHVIQALHEAAAAMDASSRSLAAAVQQSRSFVERTIGGGSTASSTGPVGGSVSNPSQLPTSLQAIVDGASFPTRNGDGRFYLAPGDPFRKVAHTMPPAPAGTFLTMVHGNESSASVGTTSLSPADLARLIRADPSYSPGQAITLFSCSTGASSTGFAKQLADELGVRVLAPTNLAWLPPDEDGTILVTPMDATRRPVRRPDGSGYGRWVWFDPS